METALCAVEQHTSKRYFFSLDVAKFICALLVIIIHTRPFSECSGIIDFYLGDVAARIAFRFSLQFPGIYFSAAYVTGTEKSATAQRTV